MHFRDLAESQLREALPDDADIAGTLADALLHHVLGGAISGGRAVEVTVRLQAILLGAPLPTKAAHADPQEEPTDHRSRS